MTSHYAACCNGHPRLVIVCGVWRHHDTTCSVPQRPALPMPGSAHGERAW